MRFEQHGQAESAQQGIRKAGGKKFRHALLRHRRFHRLLREFHFRHPRLAKQRTMQPEAAEHETGNSGPQDREIIQGHDRVHHKGKGLYVPRQFAAIRGRFNLTVT